METLHFMQRAYEMVLSCIMVIYVVLFCLEEFIIVPWRLQFGNFDYFALRGRSFNRTVIFTYCFPKYRTDHLSSRYDNIANGRILNFLNHTVYVASCSLAHLVVVPHDD